MSDSLSPYNQGVAAYNAGTPHAENPFADGDPQDRDDWDCGRRGVTPARYFKPRSVRAKFRCLESAKRYTHTTPEPSGGIDHFAYKVKLVPVMSKSKNGGYDADNENKDFYAATPGGEIEINMLSERAGLSFVPGQAYYVDFTPADG